MRDDSVTTVVCVAAVEHGVVEELLPGRGCPASQIARRPGGRGLSNVRPT